MMTDNECILRMWKEYYEAVADSGGGGRGPPLGKPKNVKGPH